MENYTKKEKKTITYEEAFIIFNKIRGYILVIALALIFLLPFIN